MDAASAIFDQVRARLLGLAYRMLGTLEEAEDVVQDVWLKWRGADLAAIVHPEAWLVTLATRTAIDRLRAARVEREHYPGLWLPEPLLTGAQATPETELERAEQVSLGLLLLLERLSPQSRAAFLLHEVLETPYGEIAQMLGKSEASCRQLVHRARAQLQDGRTRRAVAPEQHRRLLGAFAEALMHGDLSALKALLAEDAELMTDGGGRRPSFALPLAGAQRVAQFFYAAQRNYGARQRIELVSINGLCGVLRFLDGALESAQACESDGERIGLILLQRNPDKLRRIDTAWRQAARRHAGRVRYDYGVCNPLPPPP